MIEVHVGQVLSFHAVCKWSDSETIEVGALSINTEDFSSKAGTPDEGDAGYTAFAPSFSMAAYSDSTRSTFVDPDSDTVEIGEKLYVSIAEINTIESSGTFKWYVTDCTVWAEAGQTGSKYMIIKVSS